MSNKNFGYVEDIIAEDHYVLGGILTDLPTEVIQENGQWDDYIPQVEIQRTENYETYNCTAFGTLNALEFLFKRIFGEEKNWSERYVGIAAGTRPPGNSPQVVIETIRKDCGLLDDDLLPMSKAQTIEEYYSPDPLPWLMKENGKKFLNTYTIKHEWAFSAFQQENKANILKSALKYSPLGIAVYAWEVDGGLYIRPKDAEDNHWCVMYGYDDGKYFKVYDSYDSSIKFLDWNYPIFRAKRYHIEKITHKSLWESIIKYLLELFK